MLSCKIVANGFPGGFVHYSKFGFGLHNVNGPAFIPFNKLLSEYYYINGKKYLENEYFKKIAKCPK